MPGYRRYRSLWRMLTSDEPHIAARIGASIASVPLCAAAALAGSFCWVTLTTLRSVRNTELGVAFLFALVLWLSFLWWLWTRNRYASIFRRTVGATAAIAVAAILVSTYVSRHGYRIRSANTLITATVYLSIGGVLWLWTGALLRAVGGRAAITPRGEIDVRCPACGYLLVGLRELRCPECGETFTIDEVIRAQDYITPADPNTPRGGSGNLSNRS